MRRVHFRMLTSQGTGGALIILLFGLPGPSAPRRSSADRSETSSAAILYRRALRLRRATGNEKIKTRGEIEAENMSTRDIVNMSLLLPVRREPDTTLTRSSSA